VPQSAIQENGVPRKSKIETVVLLTPALRPARVPWGKSRMRSSGESNRMQFQIGNTCLRTRRLCRRFRARSRGGESLTLSRLVTNHSPLTTGFPYSSHPVCRIPTMFMKTKGIRISTRHTLARRSFVANHQSRVTNHTHSLAASFLEANGYSLQTGFPVTHSKQTTVVLSNRYDPSPCGGEWRTGYCLALHSILLIATLRKPESP
jgi:hypothetical protein